MKIYFKYLIYEMRTKLSARIDKPDENISKIYMSQMSWEKKIVQMSSYLNLYIKGGLPSDIEPNLKKLHVISTRNGLQLEELTPNMRDTNAKIT